MNSIRRSGWLFYHQNIKMFDVFLARGILVSVSVFASFVIVASVGVLFDFMPPISDPGLIVAAWCADTFFVMSFASVVAGVSGLSEVVEKLLHPLMYLTLPLTGAFTLTSWLPPPPRPNGHRVVAAGERVRNVSRWSVSRLGQDDLELAIHSRVLACSVSHRHSADETRAQNHRRAVGSVVVSRGSGPRVRPSLRRHRRKAASHSLTRGGHMFTDETRGRLRRPVAAPLYPHAHVGDFVRGRQSAGCSERDPGCRHGSAHRDGARLVLRETDGSVRPRIRTVERDHDRG